ncbi:MAG TPA: hypothetical protein VK663_01850 [Burkholderiales bacterium]|nr:hypothetical protein [Burkholderiales bacterium]
MNTNVKQHYTTLTPIDRMWLRLLLAYWEWQAENETRLISRVGGELKQGHKVMDELMAYKRNRISMWNRANEIRSRLGIVR